MQYRRPLVERKYYIFMWEGSAEWGYRTGANGNRAGGGPAGEGVSVNGRGANIYRKIHFFRRKSREEHNTFVQKIFIKFRKLFSIYVPSKHGPGQRSRYSDSLRAERSGGRIPVGGGARLAASVTTGPGAHPAIYTKCTRSFPGVKRSRRGVDHPPPSSTEVKERVQLYL